MKNLLLIALIISSLNSFSLDRFWLTIKNFQYSTGTGDFVCKTYAGNENPIPVALRNDSKSEAKEDVVSSCNRLGSLKSDCESKVECLQNIQNEKISFSAFQGGGEYIIKTALNESNTANCSVTIKGKSFEIKAPTSSEIEAVVYKICSSKGESRQNCSGLAKGCSQ